MNEIPLSMDRHGTRGRWFRAALLAAVLLASCGGARGEPVRPAPPAADTSPRASDEPAEPLVAARAAASCGPGGALAAPSDLPAAFEQARALHDASRFVEAADLYEAIVRADPHHALAGPAVDLSLEALNRVRGRERGLRAACVARIGGLAIDYGSLFACGAPGADAERCGHLERLRCDALRAEGDALAEDDESARASVAFERVHTTGCARGGDQGLYNAALLARRAGDGARADALVAELRRAYPESSVLGAPPP